MRNMKHANIRCILILAGFCLSNMMTGQAIIRFEPMRSSLNKSAFNEYFSQYTLGSIDPHQIVDLLRSRDQFDTMKILVENVEYTFSLEARDIRTDDFILFVDDGSGPVAQDRTPNITYYGKTIDSDLPVAITADDDFFTAMISSPKGDIFIEAAKKIDPGATDYDFVIYNENSLVKKFKDAMCGVVESTKESSGSTHQEATRNSLSCFEMDVALANDYLMYQKCGFDVGNVLKQNLAVLNLANTKYDDEFGYTCFLKAKVAYVYTSVNDSPWYTGVDSKTLLESFTGWAEDGFGTTHDIGALWTNRDLDGSTIGRAWVDETCDSAYTVLQAFTDNYIYLRNLMAHEIAHTFGCSHDPEPNYIMSPSVSYAENWSPTSLSVLQQSLNEISCSVPCTPGYLAGRVAIGTTSPHASAALEIKSDDKGFLMPRLPMVKRNNIHNPAEGLMVFDTDSKSFWYAKNGGWSEFPSSSTIQTNYDNSTSLGLNGNVGIGVQFPKNKLDVASISRVNPSFDATGLPFYVTGDGLETTIAEFRDKYAHSGIAIKPSGISATGNTANHSLTFAALGSAGSLNFTTNNIQQMQIDGWGNISFNSANVNFNSEKIFINSPSGLKFSATAGNRKIMLYDGYNNEHQFYGFGINPASLRYQVDGYFASHIFYSAIDANSSLELFRITGTGKIGIGNANPQNQLDLMHGAARTGTHATNRPFYITGDQHDAANGPEIRSADGQQGIGFGKNTIYATGSDTHQDLGLAARGSEGNLVFTTNGIERARIDGEGSMAIGINAANESASLKITSNIIESKVPISVKNTKRAMYIMEDEFASRMILSHSPAFPTWGLQYVAPTNEFRFLGDSVTAMSVNLENGNVSIKGAIETEAFISPPLENTFYNFGFGYSTVGYMKDKMGFVHLRGMVSHPGNPAGQVVFRLPPGYRPGGISVFPTLSNNNPARIDVWPNGDVVVNVGIGIWTSMDGITFKAEQ